jgi:hypothetical protein
MVVGEKAATVGALGSREAGCAPLSCEYGGGDMDSTHGVSEKCVRRTSISLQVGILGGRERKSMQGGMSITKSCHAQALGIPSSTWTGSLRRGTLEIQCDGTDGILMPTEEEEGKKQIGLTSGELEAIFS